MTIDPFKKLTVNTSFQWPPVVSTTGLFLVFLVFFSCTGKTTEQQGATNEEIMLTEKIRLKELNGEPIDLQQYQGKTLFINLWATWCGPCIKEMPSIERAKKVLADSDIEFLIASNESLEEIEGFIKKRNLDLHYVQLENLEELNVQALPTTFIINSKGELRFSEMGYREWDTTENIELITKIIQSNE